MGQKKLLLLGGSRYLLPVIRKAHDLDVQVITCDYLPNNIAHKYSDHYINESITDKTAILNVAKSLSIDGIMSFAADPGVTTASYVAEKLGLPFQASYDSTCIMQNKNLFRDFLEKNNFICPKHFVTTNADDALNKADSISFPIIVKPTDSAGSKGCTKVSDISMLKEAVNYALKFSLSQKCIVEEFIEKKYPSSDADGFSVDGKMCCVSFTNQLFDLDSPNPYTPAAYTMPSDIPPSLKLELENELQRLASLLNLKTGIYNIECRISPQNKPYIMEMSPRGGGNRLAEMLDYASSIDLIEASILASIGEPLQHIISGPVYNDYWYQLMLHSNKSGYFKGIKYDRSFEQNNLVEQQLWIKNNDPIHQFDSANYAFGSLFARFPSRDSLENFIAHQEDYIAIEIEE